MQPEDDYFKRGLAEGLVWSEMLGMGWYPVQESADQIGYFNHYRALAGTTIGQALTAQRVQFVSAFYQGPLVDIGVGSGAFVEARPLTRGYDVDPQAIEWLKRVELWVDPYVNEVAAACFWDSLEHIHEPRKIIDRVRHWAFVSMPIYRSLAHLMRSKHFKPREHVWYWTMHGFIEWMRAAGFRLMDTSAFESDLGREDIVTFAFNRVANPV